MSLDDMAPIDPTAGLTAWAKLAAARERGHRHEWIWAGVDYFECHLCGTSG